MKNKTGNYQILSNAFIKIKTKLKNMNKIVDKKTKQQQRR